MPYNPQIQYTGDRYLFQGGQNMMYAMTQLAQQLGQRGDQTKALRGVVKAYAGEGPQGDALKSWADSASLGDLEGAVQGFAVKAHQASAAADQQEKLARANYMQQEGQALQQKRALEADEAEAWPRFMQELTNDRQQQGGPGSGTQFTAPDLEMLKSFNGGVAPGDAPQGPPLDMVDRLVGAMGRMGATNPRLSAAVARQVLPAMLPQLTKGREGFFKPGQPVMDYPGTDWQALVTGPNTAMPVMRPNAMGAEPVHDPESGKLLGFSVRGPKGTANFHAYAGPQVQPAVDATSGQVIPGIYINGKGGQIDIRSLLQKTVGEAPAAGGGAPMALPKTSGQTARGAGISSKPMALPKTVNELNEGQVYQTDRGLAKWTGRWLQSVEQ